jgi:hypothetical protein
MDRQIENKMFPSEGGGDIIIIEDVACLHITIWRSAYQYYLLIEPFLMVLKPFLTGKFHRKGG